MEKLTTIQKIENLNEVYVVGKTGNGGAYHRYQIFRANGDVSELLEDIKFQNGARKEEDSINGVIDSDLLEIVRHRLKCFQAGEFSSVYNEKALEHIEKALYYMNKRIEDRAKRQVLGTMNK